MLATCVACAFSGCTLDSDKVPNSSLQADVIEQVNLRDLFDRFAVLADQKDVEGQLDLFTEDAVVTSRFDGVVTSTLTGKDEIGTAFSQFLSQFDTVYHQNGQHLVEVEADQASGTGYSLIILVGGPDTEKTITQMGVIYNDIYVKRGGVWLISARTSDFMWRTVEPVASISVD